MHLSRIKTTESHVFEKCWLHVKDRILKERNLVMVVTNELYLAFRDYNYKLLSNFLSNNK